MAETKNRRIAVGTPSRHEHSANRNRLRRVGNFIGSAVVISAVGTALVEGGKDIIHTAGSTNPAIVSPADIRHIPYTVGSRPEDPFVSEIASDMHPFAPNQDQVGADAAIDTYLPKPDQKNFRVYPGENFVFSVNKRTGQIIPRPDSPSSVAEN